MSGVARKETGAGKKFQAYNVNDTYKGGRPEAKAPGSELFCSQLFTLLCSSTRKLSFSSINSQRPRHDESGKGTEPPHARSDVLAESSYGKCWKRPKREPRPRRPGGLVWREGE